MPNEMEDKGKSFGHCDCPFVIVVACANQSKIRSDILHCLFVFILHVVMRLMMAVFIIAMMLFY